jgi:predicted porin
MKKSLLALAVLGGFAGVASAQSSVTLSGSLDAGIRHKGTATGYDWSMGGSQSAYNAFTISGVEDLGGGMRAFFSMNHRFNIQNGVDNGLSVGGGGVPGATTSADPNFWRNIWVGLGGGFGDVRLGRILMPLQDLNGNFDAFAIGTVATLHTGGINATNRANNAVSYRSPNLGGFTMSIATAAGEGQIAGEVGTTSSSAQQYFTKGAVFTTGFGQARPVGLYARYAAGPVDVGVAYDRNAAEMKTVGLYGSFNFGAVKLMGQFEKGDNFTSSTGAVALAASKPNENIKAFSLGLTAPVGPFLLRTGIGRINSDVKVAGNARNASKFGIGADYILSKRTSVYTDLGKWSGHRLDQTPAGSISANKKTQFDIGVHHSF